MAGEGQQKRKRHTQVSMKFRTWGGKRPGAGRPPKGPRASERHQRRPTLRPGQPVHVVLRVARDVGCLRTREMYLAIRQATLTAARRDDFRIVHLSIQGTHVHLLVEADRRTALARGMQGFQISAARHLNAAVSRRRGTRRTGTVFTDRYHLRILSTPRAVRNALAYVLNNWRHHGEDRTGRARTWTLDPFSSAVSFPGWQELAGAAATFAPPPTYRPLVTWPPKTWLLRAGWLRPGRIGAFEVPGQAALE